ncbi:hypothetical protein [Pseudoleptotrichia goodfellowii]|uniref:CRISPR-associated cxxc_cxxc protein Cst1 n=1 Tax=Pseudoleptotrichia goodfellowii F0264 TaxID=596323 RepID=D0GJK7_9FUSO|nr:hypothetical protein [Pseudoleptotrichia goodfellowii]EEY35715.1 hypothetical protein HMPREF0554_1230 [Pseudoleptotrichia goodfellowii F0264]
MSEKIEIRMSNWLFNAGLLGFINVLENSNEEIRINDEKRSIEFSPKVLENFEYKYFDFLILRYNEILPSTRILRFQENLEKIENFKNSEKENEFISKNIKELLQEINYIKNKKYNNINIEKITFEKFEATKKNIKKLDESKYEIKELKENLKNITEIIKIIEENRNSFQLEDIKTIVRYGWEGIAFLDNANIAIRRKNGIDIGSIYKIYQDFFIKDIQEYIQKDKSKFEGQCSISNAPLPIPYDKKENKNYNKTIQFLGDFFNPNDKKSNVWNFENDIYVSPIVYLIYSCVPAGFIYSNYNSKGSGKGIFINLNYNITQLKKVNNGIFSNIFEKNINEEDKLYRNIFKKFELGNQNYKYDISDIQVIKTFERREIPKKSYPKYRFNILSKRILEFIQKNLNKINSFFGKYYVFKDEKDNPKWDTTVYLYKDIIERLLENRDLFLYIDKLCYVKISERYKYNYSNKNLLDLIYINMNNMWRFRDMKDKVEKSEKEIENEQLTYKDINTIKNNAYHFREKYNKVSNNEDKIKGLQYRLQNALRTNNVDLFMDILISAHAYAGKEIHKLFLKALDNDDDFKTLGYAFLIGLLKGDKEENTNNKQVKGVE